MKVVTVECEAMSNVECEAVLSLVKSTSFHTLRSTQYRDCNIDIVKVLDCCTFAVAIVTL